MSRGAGRGNVTIDGVTPVTVGNFPVTQTIAGTVSIADGVTDGTKVSVGPYVQTPIGNRMLVQMGPGDVISNIPVIVMYDHHQIHEGETFRWSVYTSSLASGASKDIQLVVPNINVGAMNPVVMCPHIRFEMAASDLCQLFLYETPTITVAGTARTPVSLERNGTYTPKLVVREDPTVTGVGTLLWQGITFSSRPNIGGLDSATNEFVLKNNTTYLLRATSGAAGNKVLMRMEWYEDLGV